MIWKRGYPRWFDSTSSTKALTTTGASEIALFMTEDLDKLRDQLLYGDVQGWCSRLAASTSSALEVKFYEKHKVGDGSLR